jgi:acetyltransferase-like isoleucine patch superfamily enzyme
MQVRAAVNSNEVLTSVGEPASIVQAAFLDRLRRFWHYPFLEKVESVVEFYWLCKTQLYYRHFFGRIGAHSKILEPLRLKNVQHIFVGETVIINRCAFLLTLSLPDQSAPRLEINDGCVIGHMNHITCVNEVTIGSKVLTADRVHISDNSHIFTDPSLAIVEQGVKSTGRVNIGEGTWIGENASVLSCSIGKHCVIGANAVVVTDIPDYCVAVGMPARVVRRFNQRSGLWERTTAEEVSECTQS